MRVLASRTSAVIVTQDRALASAAARSTFFVWTEKSGRRCKGQLIFGLRLALSVLAADVFRCVRDGGRGTDESTLLSQALLF